MFSLSRSGSESVTTNRYELEGRITRVVKGAETLSFYAIIDITCLGERDDGK